MANTKYLIAVVGPTASGKTALAIKLAQRFNTAIISADSRQFYSELIVGVARPSKEELGAAPHYFIADRSVKNLLTAGQFEKEALTLLDELYKEHDVVIVCGGSGLFINTLVYGADPMPEADEELRQSLQQHFDEKGIEYLQQESDLGVREMPSVIAVQAHRAARDHLFGHLRQFSKVCFAVL